MLRAGNFIFLMATLPRDEVSQRDSHETIYANPRGELRRELVVYLRMARAKHWPRSPTRD